MKTITPRELPTVLAALKNFARDMRSSSERSDREYFGQHDPLSEDEISALCLRLSADVEPVSQGVVLPLCRSLSLTEDHTVLAEKIFTDDRYSVVLCRVTNGQPYVTWQVNQERRPSMGHYFNEFEDAVSDFLQRG